MAKSVGFRRREKGFAGRLQVFVGRKKSGLVEREAREGFQRAGIVGSRSTVLQVKVSLHAPTLIGHLIPTTDNPKQDTS